MATATHTPAVTEVTTPESVTLVLTPEEAQILRSMCDHTTSVNESSKLAARIGQALGNAGVNYGTHNVTLSADYGSSISMTVTKGR